MVSAPTYREGLKTRKGQKRKRKAFGLTFVTQNGHLSVQRSYKCTYTNKTPIYYLPKKGLRARDSGGKTLNLGIKKKGSLSTVYCIQFTLSVLFKLLLLCQMSPRMASYTREDPRELSKGVLVHDSTMAMIERIPRIFRSFLCLFQLKSDKRRYFFYFFQLHK